MEKPNKETINYFIFTFFLSFILAFIASVLNFRSIFIYAIVFLVLIMTTAIYLVRTKTFELTNKAMYVCAGKVRLRSILYSTIKSARITKRKTNHKIDECLVLTCKYFGKETFHLSHVKNHKKFIAEFEKKSKIKVSKK